MREHVLRSGSPEDTRAIGQKVGALLRAGDVVSLTGELGAGKTCFVQGAAEALGVTERVTSPSFILRKDYLGRIPMFHMDVYRLQTLQDVMDIGWDDASDAQRVAFVEWGDAMSQLLPDQHLEIELRVVEDDGFAPGMEPRVIVLRAHGDQWLARLEELVTALAPWEAGG